MKIKPLLFPVHRNLNDEGILKYMRVKRQPAARDLECSLISTRLDSEQHTFFRRPANSTARLRLHLDESEDSTGKSSLLIARGLRNLKLLKNCSIKAEEFACYKSRAKAFAWATKDLVNLQTLNLNFSYDYALNEISSKLLFKALAALAHLQQLKLKFIDCKQLNGASLELLMRGLFKARHLHTFILKFKHNRNSLTSASVAVLIEQLARHPHLKNVHLQLELVPHSKQYTNTMPKVLRFTAPKDFSALSHSVEFILLHDTNLKQK